MLTYADICWQALQGLGDAGGAREAYCRGLELLPGSSQLRQALVSLDAAKGIGERVISALQCVCVGVCVCVCVLDAAAG